MGLSFDEQREVLKKKILEESGLVGQAAMNAIDKHLEQEAEKAAARLERAQRMAQRDADAYNEQEGTLTGERCTNCKNKGYIALVKDAFAVLQPCKCMKAREAVQNIARSGLKNVIDYYTFDTFETDNPIAEGMKQTAMKFLKSPDAWMYMGGQVGCGKTHICTAVCGELLRAGKQVVYMLWKDEATKLKALVNEPEYEDEIGKYKFCEVLYIDDLWKPVKMKDGDGLTGADVRLLFEIINSRYAGRRQTIISSERLLSDIIEIDGATGSRIYQMAKGFTVGIPYGKGKNRRLN
jgi:DNA replication protein DnaC